MKLDNKYFRYFVVEPRCWLRLFVLTVCMIAVAFQLWYREAQAKRLNDLKVKSALIAKISEMENSLKIKAQLQAFRNQGEGDLANVQLSKISGIAMQGDTPAVLIDNTVYSEGSTFGDYVIQKITDKVVTLINRKTNAVKNLYVFE